MNQHSILLAFLKANGRTSCADLERLCDVRSVTTRMSELIHERGAHIVKSLDYLPNTRGKPRRVTFYELAGEAVQSDLFEIK